LNCVTSHLSVAGVPSAFPQLELALVPAFRIKNKNMKKEKSCSFMAMMQIVFM